MQEPLNPVHREHRSPAWSVAGFTVDVLLSSGSAVASVIGAGGAAA